MAFIGCILAIPLKKICVCGQKMENCYFCTMQDTIRENISVRRVWVELMLSCRTIGKSFFP